MQDAAAKTPTMGPYQLLGELGGGGVATVYRARHQDSGAVVALKTPKRVREAHLGSLRREVDALRRLAHPGIVRILDDGVDAGRPWYAMEIVDGQPLGDWLPHNRAQLSATTLPTPTGPVEVPPGLPAPRRLSVALRPHRPTDLTSILTLFRQLCTPLGLIHGQGIVHGDLKPGNVLVRADGSPVVVDFGLAERWGGAGGKEQLEARPPLAGTALYMSPEQIRGARLDARADLYALGCMLFEAVAGQPPFLGNAVNEVLGYHLHAAPPRLSERVMDVPPALDELVAKMLEKDPVHRIGHATDVATVLATLGGADWPQALSAQPRPYLYRPRLAGREDVVARIERLLDDAALKRGRLALLVGEAGIGKSSVADQIARRAMMRGMRVVAGEGVALGVGSDAARQRDRTLHPFSRLLQAVADRCSEGGPEVYARLLGGRAGVLAVCEPSLRNLPGDDGTEPPELPPEAARRRLLEAMADTLAALAEERTLLLIVEDLHFADELSVAFLRSLPESFFASRSLLVLATTRGAAGPGELERLSSRPDAVRIDLAPLAAPAVASLVGDMLATHPPPAELLARVAELSAGHPFFVTEYLRAALTEGHLRRDQHGHWRIDAAVGTALAAPLPSDLEGLMARRLGRLEPLPRKILEVAAVLGREMEGDLLLAVAARAALEPDGDADTAVGAALRVLEREQILEDTTPGRLRFVHDHLREAAARLAPKERWRTLHRAAAETVEALPAGAWARSDARLGHHFAEAGDVDRAVTYLERAGVTARRSFALSEAIDHFERALALSPAPAGATAAEQHARWKRELGDACMGLGRSRDSYLHLCEAAALLGVPLPTGRLAMAAALAWEILRQIATRIRGARTVIKETEASRTAEEAAQLYRSLGYVSYYVANRLDELLLAVLRLLNLAERSPSRATRAIAYGGAQVAASFVPLPRTARLYGRLAMDALSGTADAAVTSFVHLLLAVHDVGVARWEDAITHCQRVIETARTIGFSHRLEEGLAARATVHLLRGHLAQAENDYRASLASAVRGSPHTEHGGHLGLATVYVRMGRLDEARAAESAGRRLLDERGFGRLEEIRSLATRSVLHLRMGRLAEARADAEAAAEAITSGTPLATYNILPYGWTAETFVALWADAHGADRAVLERRVHASLDQLSRCARVFPAAGAVRDLYQGVYAWRASHRSAATRTWRRGHKIAVRYGLDYEAAIIELLLLRTADKAGPDREQVAAKLLACGATVDPEALLPVGPWAFGTGR